jgi:hypothetical protein
MGDWVPEARSAYQTQEHGLSIRHAPDIVTGGSLHEHDGCRRGSRHAQELKDEKCNDEWALVPLYGNFAVIDSRNVSDREPLEFARARGAGGRRNQFARDFILSLAGLIRFGDRARRAVPPKLFPSSCFGGRCGNTVGRTLASPFGGARPRGPGRVDSPRNLRTSGRTMASRCGSA